MRVSKQAFNLVNVSYEEYLIYCDIYRKDFYKKKTLVSFFEGIREGTIIRDLQKGMLVNVKIEGEKNEKRKENNREES